MVKHWIFVTKPKKYGVCSKYKVFGVDERYSITVLNHLEPGDLVFFYINKYRIFEGPWKIVEMGIYDPLHKAVKEWEPQNKYVYLIRLDYALDKIITCPLERVFDKLLFLTNRKRGKGGYSGHFQFSIISIREEDYKTILTCADEQF